MCNVRWVVLGILLASRCFAADQIVAKVSYSEAAVLLADKALIRPRVEAVLIGGQKVRGKLEAASPDIISISKKLSIPLRDVASVRFPGSRTSGLRRATGVTLGVIGGWMLVGPIVFGVGDIGPTAALTAITGLPILGGWAGAKMAERGQDIVYVLRAAPPVDATPRLPPLQLSPPSPQR